MTANWKPIESAPKDRRITLWVDVKVPSLPGRSSGLVGPWIGRWRDDGNEEGYKPYWGIDGLITWVEAWDAGYQITHWDELPEGPGEERRP